MSDFPDKNNYRISQSLSHLNFINKYLNTYNNKLIIKKEKEQYIYDIDENKYVDFFLNNGSVILGHTNKYLSRYIKNGISIGITSSVHYNKFYMRLIKEVKKFSDFISINFFDNYIDGYLFLFKLIKPKIVGLTSNYLYNKLKDIFYHINFEIVNKNKDYDLIIYELIDFDNDLSDINAKDFKSKYIVRDESRTGFRITEGIFNNLDSCDYSISCNNISNGMDSCIIVSKKHFLNNYNPPLSIYKIQSIYEFLKKISKIKKINVVALPSNENIIVRDSIFKIKIEIDYNELLKNGIFIRDKINFLTPLHSIFDIKRLYRALKIL